MPKNKQDTTMAKAPQRSKKGASGKRKVFTLPKVDDLLAAGAQFGHSTQRWHPAYKKYIYKKRGNIYIINVEKTLKQLEKALEYLAKRLEENPDLDILVIGTKKQVASKIKELGNQYGLYYVAHKWPGGLLTNFKRVLGSIETLQTLREQVVRQKYKLLKKELLQMRRKIEKLNRKFGGLTFMSKLPDLIIIVDTKREEVALSEARKLGIPVIAIVDSNSDPRLVDYPVPMNDDARRALSIVLDSFVQVFESLRGKRLINLRKNFEKYLKELEEKIDREFGVQTTDVGAQESPEAQEGEQKVVRVVAFTPISKLNLPEGLEEKLKLAGITTVEELRRRTLEEITAIKGIGSTSAQKIISALNKYDKR